MSKSEEPASRGRDYRRGDGPSLSLNSLHPDPHGHCQNSANRPGDLSCSCNPGSRSREVIATARAKSDQSPVPDKFPEGEHNGVPNPSGVVREIGIR
jgi:hypothetical protein